MFRVVLEKHFSKGKNQTRKGRIQEGLMQKDWV